MPNMSDKNFPHAHGSGRVVAAFQLSHPGSTQWDDENEYAPGAEAMLCIPPVLRTPSLTSTFPYPEGGPAFGTGLQKTLRQPYNATSVGVFVQGSGTRRLPYTETILPGVPGFVSGPLNAQIPNTDIYPFELVDTTVLGRTHAQVVCSAVGENFACPGYPPVLDGVGSYAYYEVGLNWELPTYRYAASLAGGVIGNFANQKIASVQRAIERTYWATATLCTSALSEFHPLVSYGPQLPDMNLQRGPGDGNLTSMASMDGYPAEIRGMASPYGVLPFAFSPPGSAVQPAFSPTDPSVDTNFKTRPYNIQAQVSAIVTRWKATVSGGLTQLEFNLAPIVRIWCLLNAADPFFGGLGPFSAPRPIPRGGVGAYRYNSDGANDVSMIPGVNVQVIQKNTSATDNTDLPVYDLGSDWSALGNPSAQPIVRTSKPVSLDFPKDDK